MASSDLDVLRLDTCTAAAVYFSDEPQPHGPGGDASHLQDHIREDPRSPRASLFFVFKGV